VVLPLPRKPVMIVTGTVFAAWFDGIRPSWWLTRTIKPTGSRKTGHGATGSA
jgi:hypothetical protein